MGGGGAAHCLADGVGRWVRGWGGGGVETETLRHSV